MRSLKKGLLTGILALAALVTAGPAHALDVAVRLATPAEVRAQGGAQGLLVPAAGPTTSRDAALAALLRGKVRNSLLEGLPGGRPLIEIGGTGDVTIWVSLPSGGKQSNSRRYPIAVVGQGYDGTLESSATRIPGLVSVADVAPTAVAIEGGDDPPIRMAGDDVDLGALDSLLRDKNAARAPAMFAVSALIALIGVVRPRAGVVAIAAVLLANLGLGLTGTGETALVVASLAAAALAAVPWSRMVEVGAVLAATVFVYLLALGVDGADVALSPLGPTQNARFYGLSNLLATLLLVAAVVGAGVVGRRYGSVVFVLVALAAFVATAGNNFGADGGGAIVLIASFSVLATMLYGKSAAVLVVAAIAALFAIDLALGESHITRALEDGVWDDLTRRADLSWERATKTWYEAAYLGGLLAALVGLVARFGRRDPILVALAVGLGVSLAVNDSPNEVLVPGVACYLAVSMWIDRVGRHEA